MNHLMILDTLVVIMLHLAVPGSGSCTSMNETKRYRIYNRGADLYVETGTRQTLEQLNSSEVNMIHRFAKRSDGSFNILRETNLTFGWNVIAGSLVDGAHLGSYTYLDKDALKWLLKAGSTGGYCLIKNKNSDKYADGRLGIGEKVRQHPFDPTNPFQEWLFLEEGSMKAVHPADAEEKICRSISGIIVCQYRFLL